MARHSGLQRQVLALYKRALTAAKRKDAATYGFVRDKFQEDARSVRRGDVDVIEHLLRKGERDLRMLETLKSVTSIQVPKT